MKTLLKRFFWWVSPVEWVADAVDYYNISIVENKIDDLNERLEYLNSEIDDSSSRLEREIHSFEKREILSELEMYSDAHNYILNRIRTRGAQRRSRSLGSLSH